ncbi:MAG: CDP-alcohol phosphatidyltransferase, partial [Streptomyces sp.]|nr:CDP-alcohol phosphatidyltransferase [Streptomyces sp.]
MPFHTRQRQSTDKAGAAGSSAEPPARLRLRRPHPRLRLRTWRADHPAVARALGVAVTVLAGALVVVSLVMPNRPEALRIAEFTRLPVEALLGAAVLTVLPRRPRLVAAWTGGVVLGALTVLDLLDIGFRQYLGRGFDIVLDWPLFSDAYAYLEDTLGGAGALGALIAALILVLAMLTLTALAVVRLSHLIARHRDTTTRTVLVLSLVWMTCTALDLKVGGVPLASERAVTLAADRGKGVRETIRDER